MDTGNQNAPITTQSSSSNKKTKLLMMLITAIVGVVVIGGLAFVGLHSWMRSQSVSEVKEELTKAVATIESKHDETGAYPASALDSISSLSKRVILAANGSFDGTAYCISAVSVSDKSIEFYVDSSEATKGPQAGACETRSNLPAPSVPGGLSVAFANSSQVKAIWQSSLYADGYTMQCSTKKDFSNPVSVNIDDTAGICEKLKPKTTYYIRVKAENSTGESAWSVLVEAQTL